MRLNGSKEVWDLDGNHIAKYNGTKNSEGGWEDDFAWVMELQEKI